MRMRWRLLPLLFVFLAAFFFAGCANVVGGGALMSVLAFLVVALGMGGVACSDDTAYSNTPTGGWGVGDDIDSEDAGDTGLNDPMGAQDPSDVNGLDGGVAPGDVNDPGDVSTPGDVHELPDGDTRNVGGEDAGTWESCCNDGVVDSCFCPAMMACNYGIYQDCGDGLCVGGGQSCPEIEGPDVGTPDVEEPDAGEPGNWEFCCIGGVVESCFCPAGMPCNYGMYQDCGDGVCVAGWEMCPAGEEGL